MAVDDSRLRVRRELEQLGLSMESASWIVDDRPPGGWGEIVTREHLHLELAALRADLGAEIADVRIEIADVRIEIAGLAAELRAEMRDQTRWLTGVLIVTMGVVATVSAAAATLAGAV